MVGNSSTELNSFWPNQDNNSQSPLQLGRKKVNGVLISYFIWVLLFFFMDTTTQATGRK